MMFCLLIVIQTELRSIISLWSLQTLLLHHILIFAFGMCSDILVFFALFILIWQLDDQSLLGGGNVLLLTDRWHIIYLLYALYINANNETALCRQGFVIKVPFQPNLTSFPQPVNVLLLRAPTKPFLMLCWILIHVYAECACLTDWSFLFLVAWNVAVY